LETGGRSSVAKVHAAVDHLCRKGKQGDVLAAIDRAYNKRPVVATFGAGPEAATELERIEALVADAQRELPPVTGTGTSAQAEFRRREEIAKLRAADDYWKRLLDEMRERCGGGAAEREGPAVSDVATRGSAMTNRERLIAEGNMTPEGMYIPAAARAKGQSTSSASPS
jgi:hypothetical protein